MKQDPSIKEFRFHKVCAEVDFQYGAYHTSRLSAIVVEVVSDCGMTGWGECNARVMRRVFDPVRSARRLAKRLIGRSAIEPSQSLRHRPLTELADDRWSNGLNRALRVAREGISTALYDLAGKLLNRPVFEMLGGIRRLVVPGMPVIHVGTPQETAKVAKVWVNSFGFRYLKLKLGSNLPESLARLDAVRSAIGLDIDLQVDFNYAYGDARKAVEDSNELYERFQISIVEDPFRPFLELYPYPRLRERFAAKLMIDSVAYWPNVKRIVREQAADMINHHTNKRGGIDIAFMIDEYCQRHGLETAIGSSGLVGIQDRVYQQLSGMIGLTRPCESIGLDLYDSEEFEGYYGISQEVNVVANDHLRRDGDIHLNAKEGGIVIDHDRLLQLRQGSPITVS